MKIAVVDDIEDELSAARAAVGKYAKLREMSCVTAGFSSAEEFLSAISRGEQFDAVLLDIFMTGITGIDAAREIRRTNSEMEIIFLTTSRDFALEAFSVCAANYLVKPFASEQLSAALDRIFKDKPQKRTFTLRCDDGLRTFELENAEFFEVQLHNLYIYLSSGERISARLTMKAVREEIGNNADFFPCGASFLVNLRHICAVSGLELTTKSGRQIQIPRRSVTEFEKAYLEYCRRSVVK